MLLFLILTKISVLLNFEKTYIFGKVVKSHIFVKVTIYLTREKSQKIT